MKCKPDPTGSSMRGLRGYDEHWRVVCVGITRGPIGLIRYSHEKETIVLMVGLSVQLGFKSKPESKSVFSAGLGFSVLHKFKVTTLVDSRTLHY